MKKFNLFISIQIFLLFVTSCNSGFNQDEFLDKLEKQYEKNRIEVTNEYIKTGKLLRSCKGVRLAIQKIYPETLTYNDTLEFEDFNDVEIKHDSCFVVFGKCQPYFRLWDKSDIIYFHKPSRGWTWDTMCDLKTEKVISKSKTFEFEYNQFYKISGSFRRFNYSYKIYIYVDNEGNIHSYKEPLGKNI